MSTVTLAQEDEPTPGYEWREAVQHTLRNQAITLKILLFSSYNGPAILALQMSVAALRNSNVMRVEQWLAN